MAAMKITINNAGRRFNYEWILKNINYTFQSGTSYAILGPNGSGKSTLLQMIAGVLTPSIGSIEFSNDEKKIPADEVFRYISITTPHLELVEEYTLGEQIIFQEEFKPYYKKISAAEVARITELKTDAGKQIRNFSSGMKQRLKVALAVLADVPVVLLDEPTTNLDQKGLDWYLELIKNFSGDRLIVVCSNLEREYSFCNERLDVMNYK